MSGLERYKWHLLPFPEAYSARTSCFINHWEHISLWQKYRVSKSSALQERPCQCLYAALVVPVQGHCQPLASPFTCPFPTPCAIELFCESPTPITSPLDLFGHIFVLLSAAAAALPLLYKQELYSTPGVFFFFPFFH